MRRLTLIALLASQGAIAAPGTPPAAEMEADITRDESVRERTFTGGQQNIINGEDGTIDDFPMTGGLIYEGFVTYGASPFGTPPPGQARSFACSSTLIAPDVVLLAAHCVDEAVLSQDGSIDNLTFYWSRQSDLSNVISPSSPLPDDAVQAWDWAFPDEWSIDNINDLSVGAPKHDIALLFLDEALLDVPYAVLISEDEADQIETGAEVDVVGWGIQEPIGTLDLLLGSPTTSGFKQIASSVIADVGTFEFQVGASPSDARKCKGDSGGPTFLTVESDSDELMRLIGTTSRSADESLCESKGGYDTRLDAYLEWIEDEMASRCESGERAWCEDPDIITPEDYDELHRERRLACGCQSGGAPSGGLGLLALGLLALRRRR